MKTLPAHLATLRLGAAALALAAACGGGARSGVTPPGTPPGTSGPVTTAPPTSTPAPTYTPPGYTPPPSTVALTFYWSFARHVRGQADVAYDPQPGPGGAGSGACAESGVDTVVITDSTGASIDGTGAGVSCVYAGVQGASFSGFTPGSYDLVATGYRAGHALYETPFRVDVTAAGANAFDLTIPGIQDDLDLYARFLDGAGVEVWTTCATAVVDTLAYQLVDSAGTTVASGTATCSDPAGLSFQTARGDGIDRDRYTVSMQALDRGAVAFASTPPGCAAQAFDHLGADALAHGWSVGLYLAGTACR